MNIILGSANFGAIYGISNKKKIIDIISDILNIKKKRYQIKQQ